MRHGAGQPVSLGAILNEDPGDRWTTIARRVDPGDIEQTLLDLFTETEHLIQDEIGRGIVAAQAMAELADASSHALPRVRARRVLAMAEANASQFAEALATCEEGVALAERLHLPVEGARCRLASIQPLANLSRFNDAIATGTTALEMLEREGAWDLAGRAHLNIGSTWAMCDQPEKALFHFDRARDALSQIPPLLAQVEGNRGNALSDLDRYQEAEDAYARSERVFSELEMDWAAAIAASNLANLSFRQGRLDVALTHYERAFQLLVKAEAITDIARVEAERASSLSAIGLASDAVAAFDRVISQLRAHGSAIDVALARIGLGRALLLQGNVAEAESTLVSAEGSLDQEMQPMAAAQCAMLRAEISLIRGDASRAREYAHAAAGALLERPLQRSIIEILQARIALADGDPITARETLLAVLDRVQPMNIAPVIADTYQLLGRVHEELGDTTFANDARRSAIHQVERIRGTLQAERLRSAYLGDRLGVYHELYVALLREGTGEAVGEAFQVSERARSRALLDVLGSGTDHLAAASSPERELLGQIDEHQRWLNWTYSQIADGQEPDEVLLGQLRGHEQALADLVTRLGIVAAAGSPHLVPSTVAETQALLPENAALLSYMEAEGALHAILVTGEDVVAFPFLAPRAAIGELVQRLQFQIQRAIVRRPGQDRIADRLLADAQRELAALYTMLLAPMKERLSLVESLFVVPHGVLHADPFAALREDGHYLVERHMIATVPSASILRQLSPVSAPLDPDTALVVGVTDADTPELVREANAIGAMLPGSTLVAGADATVPTVTNLMEKATLVHLACHGRFHVELPGASGLRLADRWLTIKELNRLRLEAALVTLSGCETGRSRVESGDELVGLANAMLSAGAQSLLVSLWMTDDRVTSALMTDFYRHLRMGSGPPEALRRAQRTALQSHAHPAFWAPFVFIGRP